MPLGCKYKKINDFNKRLIKTKITNEKRANYEKCQLALRKVLQCLQKLF